MARRYYNTPQRVYQLFKNHPALSQIYSEFEIEIDGIKRVTEFLILNHDKIEAYDLQNIYKSRTPDTYESDQNDPVKGSVDEFINLPVTGIDQGDIYLVEEPYPGKYYYWDGIEWLEDINSRDKSRIQYLETLYQDMGYKVWEDEYGYFIAVEQDSGDIEWEQVDSAVPDTTIIRISDLPSNPTAGDIYEVLGEDLTDIIASLYGMIDKGYMPPWNQYLSPQQTNLQELLNMTVYLYRYGVTDNFYEKNIWQFIPEYDTDIMLEQPKTKLFMESIGRKLDQLEDKLTRLQDVYDIDETPDDLLNHLGQMLGYEKEDFSLSSVSFRELLKNIIEIYKIKGTNYSFSFFFKFLGFNVDLKEFYFNKDVKNPMGFPGMDIENVEYYLTTTNPILETVWGNPAPHLEPIRNLNDWNLEYDLLIANGCSNPESYMIATATYNNDGSTWHQNPWTYFKTNLIEYQLNPFFDKLNLTSSDNETIRKYIKFLSPTYLFTWININILPWIEDVNIVENVDEWLTMEIEKTMGNTESGVFNDYENVVDYLQVWDDKTNSLIPYTEADEMGLSIVNNLNLGGDDQVGAYLRHDGVYIRQPGHPSHITNIFHDGAKYLSFDNLGIMIKSTTNDDWDINPALVSDLSNSENEGTVALVDETGLYYIYKDPAPYWELIEDEASIPTTLIDKYIFTTYNQLLNKIETVLVDDDIYYLESDTTYYQYSSTPEPGWSSVIFSVVVDWVKTNVNVADIIELESLNNVRNNDVYYVINEDKFYYYSSVNSHWILIVNINDANNAALNTVHIFNNDRIISTYFGLLLKLPAEINQIYKATSTNRYYKFINEDAYWKQASSVEDRYAKWLDYSYRPLPSYPINVKPSPGIKLKVNEIDFMWDDVYEELGTWLSPGYWLQLSKDINFANLIKDEFVYNSDNYLENILLENDNYFWRIRTKNNLSIQSFTQDEMSVIDARLLNAYNNGDVTSDDLLFKDTYFTFNGTDYILNSGLVGNDLDHVIQILSLTGSRFDWGQWSSIYRFEISGLPFPHDEQIINDLSYQFIEEVRDETTNTLIAISLKIQWDAETNVEKYEIMISTDNIFSQLVHVSEVNINTLTIELPLTTLYWKYRIKKYNRDWDDWSSILNFTLDF